MKRLAPANIFFVMLLIGFHQKGTDAVSSLDNDGGNVTAGFLRVCPNTTVSLTCSHDGDSDVTRWAIGTPIDCTALVAHINPGVVPCVPSSFTVNMVSISSQPTRVSTLVLPLEQSLNGAVVTCYAGASTTDPQVGNFTIQFIGPPSTPTVDSMEYSVGDSTTGRFRSLVSSSGTFGTEVAISASVVGGSGTVVVTDNSINVTGLSYTRSHIVRVVATSAVCPRVNNSSIDVPVVFNIKTPVLTQLTGFVECSNSSLPIRGSWSLIDGVQSSSDPDAQLTPPLNAVPNITYTSAGGLSGSAVFVPDSSSYQLTDTVENDVYTFTVTVTNAAGGSSSVLSDFRVTALSIDDSTVTTSGCLTVNRGPACVESTSNGNFAVMLVYGVGGTCDDDTVNGTINACIPVETMSAADFCFTATLFYNGVEIQTLSDTDFLPCQISALKAMLNAGVIVEPISGNQAEAVGHLMSATLVCSSAVFMLTGPSQVQCRNGIWRPNVSTSCSIAIWIVILIVVLVFALGVILGVVMAATCLKKLVAALSDRRCWAIIVVLCLFILGVGIGILMYACYSRCKDAQKKSMTSDEDGLTRSTSSPPPPDSLYADPNTIEHKAAPGTEDQYAMVDRKVKKNTKSKPTPPEALYQDPNTIEHETAASGDTYAVVDKPKRSSKKKGGPDVIPSASEGLTYADIDLSSKRPKPGSGQQAPQQPGEYPKEHPVEYSSVDHGNTSQL